jgi:hypothetical protein
LSGGISLSLFGLMGRLPLMPTASQQQLVVETSCAGDFFGQNESP